VPERLARDVGLVLVTNDLLWWPALGLFVRDAARIRGWRALLRGD
jgi:hypothetical protein